MPKNRPRCRRWYPSCGGLLCHSVNLLEAYYHHKSADRAGNTPLPLQAWTASELAKLPTYYVMDLGRTMAETVAAEMPSACVSGTGISAGFINHSPSGTPKAAAAIPVATSLEYDAVIQSALNSAVTEVGRPHNKNTPISAGVVDHDLIFLVETENLLSKRGLRADQSVGGVVLPKAARLLGGLAVISAIFRR